MSLGISDLETIVRKRDQKKGSLVQTHFDFKKVLGDSIDLVKSLLLNLWARLKALVRLRRLGHSGKWPGGRRGLHA